MKRLLLVSLSLMALCTGLSRAGTWVNASPESLGGLTQRLNQLHWIASGSKASTRVVYIFTDPNCPYCNDLWRAIQTVQAPDVQVRYLLVAVINEDSRGKDAAILESSDPLAELDKNERSFTAGGITAKPTLQHSTNEILHDNEALMSGLHLFGTPGLVYWDEHNKPRIFGGMPDAAQLRSIVGKR